MTRLKIIFCVVFFLNFVHIGLACDVNLCSAFRRNAELSFNAEKEIFCGSLRGYLVCLRKLSDDCIHNNHVKQVISRYSISCQSEEENKIDDPRISYFETVKKNSGFTENKKKRKSRKSKNKRTDDLYDDLGERSRKGNKREQKLEKLQDDLYDDIGEKVGKKRDDVYDDIGEKVGKKLNDVYDNIGEKVGKKRDDLFDDIGEKVGKKRDDLFDDIGEKVGRKRDDLFDDIGEKVGKKRDDLFDDIGEKSRTIRNKIIDRDDYDDTRKGRDDLKEHQNILDDTFDDAGDNKLFDDDIDNDKQRNRKYKDDYFDDVFDDKKYSGDKFISRFGYGNPRNNKNRNKSKHFRIYDEDDSDGISTKGTFNSAKDDYWDSYEGKDHFDKIQEHVEELYDRYDSGEDDENDWIDSSNESSETVNKIKQTRNSGEISDYFEDAFDGLNFLKDPFDMELDDMFPDIFENKNKIYRNPYGNNIFDIDDDLFDENILGMDDLKDTFYNRDFDNDFDEDMLKYKYISKMPELDDNSSEERRDGLFRKDIIDHEDSNSDEVWPTVSGAQNKIGRRDSNEISGNDVLNDVIDEFTDNELDDFSEKGVTINRHVSSSDENDDYQPRTPWKRRGGLLLNSGKKFRETESESDEQFISKSLFRRLPFIRRTPFRQRKQPQFRKPNDQNPFYSKQRKRNEINLPNGLTFLSDTIRSPNRFGIMNDERPTRPTTLRRSEGFNPSIERVQLANKEPIKDLSTRNSEWLFSERHTGSQTEKDFENSATYTQRSLTLLLFSLLVLFL